ncbi:hypothetical protein SAMN05216535_1154 [Stutzerimonas xanthomarina]|uniref:Uncharacterized protein n=2 Tax=Stutzerimonas xanthomarina TaxID=271420 RepID=A0A1M5QJG9_9GAMM|nr:hypothetical protein SAMN05216535_1154 [Stutzerimonas xanthomarina]SHH14128.1 hypothetical protein SAMN02744645_2667 [Stutzerimonas xanthomarina DSM 18231]
MHANRGRGPLLRLPCFQLVGRARVSREPRYSQEADPSCCAIRGACRRFELAIQQANRARSGGPHARTTARYP